MCTMFFSGRMFEGSALTMLRSLDKLLQSPDDTLVFPGQTKTLSSTHDITETTHDIIGGLDFPNGKC